MKKKLFEKIYEFKKNSKLFLKFVLYFYLVVDFLFEDILRKNKTDIKLEDNEFTTTFF